MQKQAKNLTHHFLIATPQMPDSRFNRALVYICRQDKQGVLGLVVNQPFKDTTVGHLFDDLDIDYDTKHDSSKDSNDDVNNNTNNNHIKQSEQFAINLNQEAALSGGPVFPEVGFVLHTGQPTWASSFGISENVCVTTSKDILHSIASGSGVGHFHMFLGHASWGNDQLTQEIEQGDWLVCPADLSILFDIPFSKRWHSAGLKLGVNLDLLTSDIGHA